MQSVFISGIPGSGKTYLAKKLSLEFGIKLISLDALRIEMQKDSALRPWVDFYFNLDEAEYFKNNEDAYEYLGGLIAGN